MTDPLPSRAILLDHIAALRARAAVVVTARPDLARELRYQANRIERTLQDA